MANEVAINQKDTTNQVLTRVDEMRNEGLALPKNYNVANALQIAFLKLKEESNKGKPLLNTVTKDSVVETLLNMALQGLSPAKNQCYFIAYGNKLQMQRSYKGTQAALKRIRGINDIWANVIYEDDDFEMEIDKKGIERFVGHDTNWVNRDGEIVGAYAIVDTDEQDQLLTVMTMKEIQQSWDQSRTNQGVHKKFGQEMAKRTVINRAAKNIIDTSDDSDLLIHAINDTTENEYEEDERKNVTEKETSQELLSEFKQAQPEQEETIPDNNNAPKPDDDDVPPEEPDEPDINEPIDAEFEEVDEPDEQEEPNKQEDGDINWEDYTVPQIKKSLDNYGVQYNSNARKDELIALAEMTLNGGGTQNELL